MTKPDLARSDITGKNSTRTDVEVVDTPAGNREGPTSRPTQNRTGGDLSTLGGVRRQMEVTDLTGSDITAHNGTGTDGPGYNSTRTEIKTPDGPRSDVAGASKETLDGT